jgi:hypothetical protein
MSRPYSKLALAAFLIAPAVAQVPATTGLSRFVHPNAKALISLDWRRVRQSHVGAMLREKWLSAGPAASFPGIEFLDDVDRFLISSPGRDPNSESQESPMLIAVSGHFDLAKVRGLLVRHGVKPQMFNSFQVYRPQSKGASDFAIVLFDPQTILLGDSRSMFTTLDRNAFPQAAPQAGSILARAAEFEANYEVWALITAPETIASNRLMGLLSGGEFASEARGFEFGVSLRSGLAADIAVAFESESAAKKMVSELSKVIKLTVKDKMGEPAMQDMEKHLKFSADGTRAKISLRMTPQEVAKNARIYSASRNQPARGMAQVTPTIKLTPAPPPPQKQVIRIEGLDEGPREIPIKQP